MARYFVASGGSDLRSYVSSFFPHLSSDLLSDFSSGSSILLSALRSRAPPPLSVPPASSASLLPPSAPSSSAPFPPFPPSLPSFSPASASFSSPVSSLPLPPLSLSSSSAAPAPPALPGFSGWSASASSSSSSAAFPLSLSGAFPAASAAPGLSSAAAFAVPVCSVAAPAVPVVSFAVPVASVGVPAAPVAAAPGGSSLPSSAYPPAPDPFVPADPDDPFPDPEAAVPQAVPDASRPDLRRMYSFITQLFPAAEGVPPPSPPQRALFEEFFAPPPSAPLPIYLNWFERVRTILSETDSRLPSFLASGRALSYLLPGRSSQFAVHGEGALSGAAELNPSFAALIDRPLRPSLHVGMSIKEAAACEASLRFQSEALSHAMWLLTSLLAYVRLQGFQPEDPLLFNTIVSSLSKCLAHQASASASTTAFLGLKRREFYLSHLPAYFSDRNKRSMLSSPLLGSQFLFAEPDIARLVAETQTASSLKSQQAMVDVASRGAGSRSRKFSPRRSPGGASPSRSRRAGSRSPARNKRVRFDSPAPSSALKPKSGFRR